MVRSSAEVSICCAHTPRHCVPYKEYVYTILHFQFERSLHAFRPAAANVLRVSDTKKKNYKNQQKHDIDANETRREVIVTTSEVLKIYASY